MVPSETPSPTSATPTPLRSTSQPPSQPTNPSVNPAGRDASSPPPLGDATPNPPPGSGSCGKYPCHDDIPGWVARIQVPPGFNVSYVGKLPGGEHPTSITFGPDGRLYASTMEGDVYVFDAAGNSSLYTSGFYLPIGLAFRPGTSDLYIASRTFPPDAVPNEGKVTIVRPDGSKQDIVTGLPCCYTSIEHQPNSIAFGPDGKVYLSIGARADHGEEPGQPDVPATLTPYEAGILRFNPDGSGLERYAVGLRNPYDLAFDANGRLFATDNSPDFGPPDGLHHIVQGGHYGYPYYDCGICQKAPPDLVITPPIATFIPHAAITGITAYTSNAFPPNYTNDLFVVLWSAFPGAQKVVRVSTFPTAVSDFALGFASPIDVTQSPDGALLVADWATGHIFKISHGP
ncbi:MAG: PQQ-dependent sugar dehydrogenase [Anaerolineae bacterium]